MVCGQQRRVDRSVRLFLRELRLAHREIAHRLHDEHRPGEVLLAGRARDRQRTADVPLGRVEARDAILHPAEEAHRQQLRRPFGVAQAVRDRRCARCERARGRYVAEAVLGQCVRGARTRLEGRRGQLAARDRLRPVAHAAPVGAEEAAERDAQPQLGCARRVLVEVCERRQHEALRFVVFSEQVFDQRRRRDGAAAHDRVVAEQGEHLLEGRAALRQLSRRAERDGHRERQLEAQVGALLVR